MEYWVMCRPNERKWKKKEKKSRRHSALIFQHTEPHLLQSNPFGDPVTGLLGCVGALWTGSIACCNMEILRERGCQGISPLLNSFSQCSRFAKKPTRPKGGGVCVFICIYECMCVYVYMYVCVCLYIQNYILFFDLQKKQLSINWVILPV